MDVGGDMALRMFTLSLAVAGALVILTGCSQGPDPQIVKMNQVLDELELSSISEVACDYTLVPGFVNPSGNVHQRSIGLEGTGHSAEAIERLEVAGFTVVEERDDHVTLVGPDGIEAGVSTTPEDFEGNGKEVRYDGSYSCTYPATGMTEVSLKLE
jgi:hypothetical protein